jgi:hypothetical protein
VTTTQPTEEPEYVEHHTADENQTEPGWILFISNLLDLLFFFCQFNDPWSFHDIRLKEEDATGIKTVQSGLW